MFNKLINQCIQLIAIKFLKASIGAYLTQTQNTDTALI